MQNKTCDSFFRLHSSNMPKIKNDPDRESRIHNEAIVDCRPEELAMGWYYYLQDKISFPFEGKIRKNRSISPFKKDEPVTVLDLEVEDECESEIWVKVQHKDPNLKLSIPLETVTPVSVNEETEEAVLDWHYWRDKGYSFH